MTTYADQNAAIGLDTVVENSSLEDVSQVATATATKIPDLTEPVHRDSALEVEEDVKLSKNSVLSRSDFISSGSLNALEYESNELDRSLLDSNPNKTFNYCAIGQVKKAGKSINCIIGFDEKDSPNAYLEDTVFPFLLPAIEKLLLQAKDQSIERNAAFLNQSHSGSNPNINKGAADLESAKHVFPPPPNSKLYDCDKQTYIHPLKWLARAIAKTQQNSDLLSRLDAHEPPLLEVSNENGVEKLILSDEFQYDQNISV